MLRRRLYAEIQFQTSVCVCDDYSNITQNDIILFFVEQFYRKRICTYCEVKNLKPVLQ